MQTSILFSDICRPNSGVSCWLMTLILDTAFHAGVRSAKACRILHTKVMPIFFDPGPATSPPAPPASHEQPTSAVICGRSITTPATFHWAACSCCTLVYFVLWAAFCELLWPPLSGCLWRVLLFLPWEVAVDWLAGMYLDFQHLFALWF